MNNKLIKYGDEFCFYQPAKEKQETKTKDTGLKIDLTANKRQKRLPGTRRKRNSCTPCSLTPPRADGRCSSSPV